MRTFGGGCGTSKSPFGGLAQSLRPKCNDAEGILRDPDALRAFEAFEAGPRGMPKVQRRSHVCQRVSSEGVEKPGRHQIRRMT